jgi:hypothetical protein
MDFLRVWLTGLLHPSTTMEALRTRPAPFWGLKAVTVRFVGTSLLVALPLSLLERTPFHPSYLVFIKDENYYLMLVFLFPVFGVFTWLLMSSCAHVGLRLFSRQSEFDLIANVIGISMLIPMPIVWVWDLTTIVTGAYALAPMAVSHTLFQTWETALGVLGLKRVIGLNTRTSVFVAIGVNLIYVLMGALLSR